MSVSITPRVLQGMKLAISRLRLGLPSIPSVQLSHFLKWLCSLKCLCISRSPDEKACSRYICLASLTTSFVFVSSGIFWYSSVLFDIFSVRLSSPLWEIEALVLPFSPSWFTCSNTSEIIGALVPSWYADPAVSLILHPWLGLKIEVASISRSKYVKILDSYTLTDDRTRNQVW